MISTLATIDLEVWEGATFYRVFTWETGTPSAPVDLSSVTARMQARDNIEDEDPVFDLTTENGGIVILSPANAGKYAITLTPTQTAGLCETHEKRVVVYDLFFYNGADGNIALQQKGKIAIYPTVTRPD